MLANFKNEINSQYKQLPQQLVDSLSNKLPDGLKYVQCKDGVCTIVSDDDSIRIDGLEIQITDKMKKVLGSSFSTIDLQNYLYNSQTTVELKPVNPGYITVDGKKIKMEEFIYEPFSRLHYDNRKFYLQPPPMKEKIEFNIGTKDYSEKIEFKRKPDDSINNIRFVSTKKSHLVMEIYFDDNDKKIDLKVSYNLKGILKIEEVVEVLEVYYAFVDGKGYINGNIVKGTNKNTDKSIDNKRLDFWKRFLSVEKELDKSFDLSKNGYGITDEEIDDINELYLNLIEKKPIRINNRINDISGILDKDKELLEKVPQNTTIMSRFNIKTTYTIKGRRITLPSIVMMFNARCTKVIIKDKKYKMLFEDISEEKKMYYSVMSFLNQETMEEFLKDEKKAISIFEKAKQKGELL